MYQVDENDRVIELKDMPQSSIGAPIPFVMSDERTVVLAYYLENVPKNWDWTTVRIVGLDTEGEPVALVQLKGYHAYVFGPPNDEAFSGHPLASRGLRPYGVYPVENSSWIRSLERMNSVHPYHKPDKFEELKHFVFAFHDSTFECVAKEFSLTTHTGSIRSLMPEMEALLD